MLASAGPIPGDADTRYALEWKYDGIRCLAQVYEGVCRMRTRNGTSITARFPEVASALITVAAGTEMIVDGELVAPDDHGIPRFARIGHRLGVVRPAQALLRSVPVRLYVFDLLSWQGRDLRGLTYLDRRERLARLPIPDDGAIVLSPFYIGVPVTRMLEVAAEHQVEGVIAKRVDSTYRAGRSNAWRKLPLRRTTEAVIVGWLPGRGPSEVFGSLLIAAYDTDDQLVLLGAVGTGFTTAARTALHHELIDLTVAEPPMTGPIPREISASARWVAPHLVGDVAYRERTGSGLRHPSWRGLRFDVPAHQVRLPPTV